MKAKTILKSLFISGMVLFMTTAQAQPRGNGQMNRLDCIPDLTEQQEEQISDKRTAHLKNVQSINSDLEIKRAEKRKLMLQDNPDQASINKKIDEITTLNAKRQKERAKFNLSVKNILTDEQKAVWNTHHHKRCNMAKGKRHYSDEHHNRGEGRGMGRGRGRGM